MEFDLEAGSAPDYTKDNTQLEKYSTQLAIISYAINSISSSNKRLNVSAQDLKRVKNGKLGAPVSFDVVRGKGTDRRDTKAGAR
jgi:hypothetical protein